jgi:hypothetical protein
LLAQHFVLTAISFGHDEYDETIITQYEKQDQQ